VPREKALLPQERILHRVKNKKKNKLQGSEATPFELVLFVAAFIFSSALF
jgi:hypothetical protein